MAVDQLVKFVEEGSIKNSVNYPKLCAGKKNGAFRIQILRKADNTFLAHLTKALAGKANIKNIVDKANADYAATVVDLDGELADLSLVSGLAGVIRCRIV